MLVSNEKIEVWGLVMMRSEPGIKKVKTIFENREISYSFKLVKILITEFMLVQDMSNRF